MVEVLEIADILISNFQSQISEEITQSLSHNPSSQLSAEVKEVEWLSLDSLLNEEEDVHELK
eukprot:CAMPEP_0202967738 /NCGR_PEP_ID=MMETSP1396-20130829/12733_1 /ASSEMBLY_ACC=CAM_ASM_000872 /TAXON_ID= /ORGANISM="Pseudokeronopsis sp., Strain Brazil" /LENGTH=61 /DNA_ID=CAMNT_0049693159 /DNA_START=2229 /DNA_END=2414 /DNA_ORIENTATION=-